MQIALASFAVMSLVFAGCNAKKEEKGEMAPKEEGTAVEESAEPAADAAMEATAPAADTATETKAQ